MMFKPARIQDNAQDGCAGAVPGGPECVVGTPPAPDPLAEARERLRRFGPRALSDAELLGWVLDARPGPDPFAASRGLLATVPLAELVGASASRLAGLPGLGPARARRLLAALELGRRAAVPVPVAGLLVRRPEDLTGVLRDEFRGLDRERFIALYLDARHRVRALETVSIGSLNASLVHPREVFKPAIALSAAAVIVAHNHPSGDPRPSGDDLELTGRLDKCGELLGIALLDHLVVGDADITSIREYGWPAPTHG
jgi:DNA repair protein RadC